MRMPRFVPSLVLLALPLACAQGSDDPGMLTLSGAYTAGEAGSSDPGDSDDEGESATDGQTSASTVSGGATSNSGDSGGTGNPACCMIAPTPGCGSPETESCVCTSLPSCCQQVWGADCVDQAIVCGDPYCVDDSAGDDTTTGGGPDLECDPDFGFSPQNPGAGVPFEATFTDPVGLTYIGMWAEGPSGEMIEGGLSDIIGAYTWHFQFAGMASGIWTFTFTWHQNDGDPDIIQGVCQKQF